MTVTPVFGLNQDPRRDRLDHAFTVTDPAKVARIVALANGLTVYPPGAYPCPASFGGAMRLAFLDRPGGQVLARFSAQYGGCGVVSVSIGGKTSPRSALYDLRAAVPGPGPGHRGRALAAPAGRPGRGMGTDGGSYLT